MDREEELFNIIKGLIEIVDGLVSRIDKLEKKEVKKCAQT